MRLLSLVASSLLIAAVPGMPAHAQGWFSPPALERAEPAQPRATPTQAPAARPSAATPGELPPAGVAAPAAPATAPAADASATAPIPAATSATDAPDVYRLGTGDKVRVIVFGEADLSGEFEIDTTGRISLQLIGLVQAAGLSSEELKAEIEHRLTGGYLLKPSVAVEVLTYRPFYVLGEVNAPGSFPYVSGMTVLKAVAIAGGFTPRARKGQVELLPRGDQSRLVKVGPETRLEPGDVVRVGERIF